MLSKIKINKNIGALSGYIAGVAIDQAIDKGTKLYKKTLLC